jgi:FkbM family methyltransferase
LNTFPDVKWRTLAKKLSLAVLYHSPPLPQRVRGRTIWVHPRARFSVSTQTFFKREPHVRKWLAERLGPGDTFFDIGAHHGWYSIWASSLVGDDGAVYLFEPSPANLSILHWHRNRNHFGQWTIVAKAVSDEDSSGSHFVLIDAGDSPMNSLTTGAPGMPLMEGRDIRMTSVRTVTLDSFCQQSGVRPNVVKVDVEGAELLVLHGARRLLDETRPILLLAVHPYWLPAGQSPGQIRQLLDELGYCVFDAQGKAAAFLSAGEYLCLDKRQAGDRLALV